MGMFTNDDGSTNFAGYVVAGAAAVAAGAVCYGVYRQAKMYNAIEDAVNDQRQALAMACSNNNNTLASARQAAAQALNGGNGNP